MSFSQLIPFEWPGWALMWAVALVIYTGCKWLTWHRTATRNVPLWKHAAYLLAWPGMDAMSFLGEESTSNRSRCRSVEWLAAAAKLIVGVSLLFGVARGIPP